MPVESGDVLTRAWSIATNLVDLDPTTAAIGLAALAVLFIGARFAPRVPWALVVLIVGIGVSSWLDLAAQGVVTVGDVPSGLPPFGLPEISVTDIPPVLVGSLALALVGLAEGLSAARLFAAREGYTVDANQELVATGAANVAAGLSGGLGVAGSLSKTAASRRSGGVSQLTGVTTAVLVLLVLVALANLLSPLPRAVLSAIVIQAVWGLMDVKALRRYKAIRRNDFVGSMAAMGGVLLFGPLYGLLLAVGQAVLGLVYRSSRVGMDVMGKVPGEKAAWGSVIRHPERKTIDGILVLRLDAPLFWANAAEVQAQVLAAVEAEPDVRVLLLDLEATSQLDTTSIDALELMLAAPAGTRGRALPGARLLPGAAGAHPGRLHRAARRRPHVAQHLRGGSGRAGGRPPRRQGAQPYLAVELEESADDVYEPADERIAVESSADNGDDEAAAPEPKATKGPKPPRRPSRPRPTRAAREARRAFRCGRRPRRGRRRAAPSGRPIRAARPPSAR